MLRYDTDQLVSRPIATMTAPDHASGDESLLQVILKPLLDDFEGWFQQALDLFTTEDLRSMSAEHQADLVERVTAALEETRTAATLLRLTQGQVGVETAQVMAWHQLVAECWQAARRHRSF